MLNPSRYVFELEETFFRDPNKLGLASATEWTHGPSGTTTRKALPRVRLNGFRCNLREQTKVTVSKGLDTDATTMDNAMLSRL